jgi:phosphonate transport system substrate-binding protein
VNKDSSYEHLEDLKGRVFAFTDPHSHTGKLVPTQWLREINARPDTFFREVIYTYSHDNSIMGVAKGLVDGAAVDGLIWEYYHQNTSPLTAGTRIIKKSEPFGIPPVVVSRNLSPELKDRARYLLISMHESQEGSKILKELMIDRFVEPQENWYESILQIEQMMLSE